MGSVKGIKQAGGAHDLERNSCASERWKWGRGKVRRIVEDCFRNIHPLPAIVIFEMWKLSCRLSPKDLSHQRVDDTPGAGEGAAML